jgi:hypothetical protein
MTLGARRGHQAPITEIVERPAVSAIDAAAVAVPTMAIDASNTLGGVNPGLMLDPLLGMTKPTRSFLGIGTQATSAQGHANKTCNTDRGQPHATLAP